MRAGWILRFIRALIAQTDEGHQEYYFGLLNENEQRGYREILEGIRSFEDKFYLSLSAGCFPSYSFFLKKRVLFV